MHTIRRLYLYAVSFISLETVLWGIIGLARSFTSGQLQMTRFELLAGALALILVGIPVFLLHGWLAQKAALRDPEERFTRIRAAFLYGALAATLLPVVQNFVAILARLLLEALGADLQWAMVGKDQSFADNLIAIAANALAAAGLYSLLRKDWQSGPRGESYPETRRFFRYLWSIYGLGLAVLGSQQVLYYLLSFWQAAAGDVRDSLANGLALLVTGAPIWFYIRWQLGRVKQEPQEQGSSLRLEVFYALVFLSAAGVLASGSLALKAGIDQLMRTALRVSPSITNFLVNIAEPLSAMLPLGGVWFYYSQQLNMGIKPRRKAPGNGKMPAQDHGLRRMYFYGLAALGLGAVVGSTQGLLKYLLEVIFGETQLSTPLWIRQFSTALSTLILGLPLWLFCWRPMRREAAQEGEAGDHARRSITRKAFLYLAMFAGIVGLMYGTGTLLYQVFRAWLLGPPDNLLLQIAQALRLSALYALVLIYHRRALRQDERLAERSLSKRHTQFPVLILAPDDGDFATKMINALYKQAPDLPVAVHPYSQGAPDETLSAARAVILPAELLARPSEAIRLWLQAFTGIRLVIPTPAKGWYWVMNKSVSLTNTSRQAALAIRRFAEEKDISPSHPTSSPGKI